MGNLYNKIEALCKDKGVNITRMCRESGIPRATLSELKMGRTAMLSTKNMEKLSAYFNVSVDDLLGNGQKETPASQGGERSYADMELIEAFLAADESTRAAIRLLLKL